MTAAALAGLRVLVVLAHPDDESLACGGTIARLARAGAHVHLICATHGEAGRLSHALPDGPAALLALRARELRAACARLGVTGVELLAFPDGVLKWEDAEPLIDVLEARLRALVPEVVITFGRDGLYWHPDHIALGERVRTAVARCAADVPVAAYAVVMPPGAMTEVASRAVRADRTLVPAFWGVAPEIFGKGALPGTRIVAVDDTLDVKIAALRCHASQLDPTNPLAQLTSATAAPLAEEHFHLLETSPRHRSAFDLLARPARM